MLSVSRLRSVILPPRRVALFLLAAGLGAAVGSTSSAYGGLDNYQLTREEVALLPEFCRHTQLIIERHGSAPAQREWVERVGPSFMHMHHYCIAVVAYVRSFRHTNSITDRKGYLGFAEDNLSYVVRNAEPTFALLPEVLFRRGQTRVRLGKIAEGIKDLEDAIAADPKHARAHYALAQALLGRNDRKGAEAALRTGLKHSPESRLLKSALAELQSGGNK